MTRVVASVGMVVLLAGVASCGGRATTSAKVSAALLNEVRQVRTAAGAHDTTTATARLDDIRRSVAVLRGSGQLSDATAGRILIAADAVQSDLRLVSTTSTLWTTSTSTSTAPTTAAPPPPARPGKGHGTREHGKDGGD